jgi:hypothetical protein
VLVLRAMMVQVRDLRWALPNRNIRGHRAHRLGLAHYWPSNDRTFRVYAQGVRFLMVVESLMTVRPGGDPEV